jgi:hypothetical protein
MLGPMAGQIGRVPGSDFDMTGQKWRVPGPLTHMYGNFGAGNCLLSGQKGPHAALSRGWVALGALLSRERCWSSLREGGAEQRIALDWGESM